MTDEELYAALADEVNEASITCARCGLEQNLRVECRRCGNDLDPMADFDHHAVVAGERYAKANGLAWPPQVGDFDRYYERNL